MHQQNLAIRIKKDDFYEVLTKIYEVIRKDIIKIVMGDMNTKYGKESHYIPAIGKEWLHTHCNDNGLRLVSFTASNSITISSTTFLHKTILNETW